MKPNFLLITLGFLSIFSPQYCQQNDYPRDYSRDEDQERIFHNNRRRPCRPRDVDGRTFLDWTYSYISVNQNYNYVTNCGGGGSGGAPHRPQRPQRPQRPGGHQGLQGLFSGSGGGHQGLQGLFSGNGGGQGTNGNNHMSSGSSGGGGGGNGIFGNNGGLFGLGLFNGGLFNRPTTHRPETPPEVLPEDENTDNDVEKPVSEDYDDVVPEAFTLRPGNYIAASNPLLGNYVQDVTNFNPNRIIRRVNKEFNGFFRPLYSLLRR